MQINKENKEFYKQIRELLVKGNQESGMQDKDKELENNPLVISLKEDITKIREIENKKSANVFLAEFVQGLLDKEDYCIDIKNKYERQERRKNSKKM